MTDCRHIHPAYSEAHRFSMMEALLQSLLKRKHLPLGVLSYLEDEMIEIFAHDPLSVYITSELSSFERLLLHALCQYYFLRSKSTTIAGVRRTKVENANKCFHEPDISLATYIDKFYRR
ncbi:R3H domain-containing protein 4 [Chionoecetes opilio]|uniref:R3H domain-containing protein 4 n=1 Tax=Chionoecetes opilio TaxID=41210 RepID=A0A8J4Y9K3_CHIOP|nr:R3H domain-containing protein 4 [Chionoecetes opilio]